MMVERRGSYHKSTAFEVTPGSIAVVMKHEALMVVVGSNVAVCVWERNARVAGMVNFSRPRTCNCHEARAIYGNVAILGLLRMLTRECPNGVFEAHIFGGAALDQNNSIGADNIAMARRILVAKGIEIVSEDTGGRKGRKILFDTKSGQVVTLKVHELRNEDWENEKTTAR